MQLKLHDKVWFGRRNGEKTRGTIVKVLPSGKLKVRQDEERGTQRTHPIGTIWTMHPVSCWLQDGAEEARRAAAPAPAYKQPLFGREEAPIIASIFQDRTEVHILMAIMDVYCSLSPENLHGDGEIPIAQVRRRHAELTKKLTGLQTVLGRNVSETTVFKWYEDHKKLKINHANQLD